jgi:SAM-dependent methyltransferase
VTSNSTFRKKELFMSDENIIQACPICSGKSYKYFEHRDFFGEIVSVYKCINCGHGAYNNIYTEEQFSEIYRENYADNYLLEEGVLYEQRQIQYKLDVSLLLANRTFKDVRVLDYGCSSGAYLDAMPETWIKTGYEVNPYHINYLKNKGNIQVFNSLEDIDGSFDLITLRGVIEHIPDHSKLVNLLSHHLAPGGAVYITATPDFSSTCAVIYKSQWNQVSCPEHIHCFTPASLSILLLRAGMALHSLNHPYIDTPYANWSSDKNKFFNNYHNLQNYHGAVTAHAFPGNMISALYEKID